MVSFLGKKVLYAHTLLSHPLNLLLKVLNLNWNSKIKQWIILKEVKLFTFRTNNTVSKQGDDWLKLRNELVGNLKTCKVMQRNEGNQTPWNFWIPGRLFVLNLCFSFRQGLQLLDWKPQLPVNTEHQEFWRPSPLQHFREPASPPVCSGKKIIQS